MHFQNNRKPSFMESIGQKATNLAQFGMEMKKVYDVGKVMYDGFRVAAPYIEAAMAAGL